MHRPGLKAACHAAAIALIHISTDYVSDGSKPGRYREDDPVHPLGVYKWRRITERDRCYALAAKNAS